MALLSNTFDPSRFNSTTLAVLTYEVEREATERRNHPEIVLPEWSAADEGIRMAYVDQAQQVIDRLVEQGVFHCVEPVLDSDSIPIPSSGPQ